MLLVETLPPDGKLGIMTEQYRFIRVRALTVLAALLVCAGATSAYAQSAAPESPSIIIRGGGLVADFNSGVRLDVSGGQRGTDISFENDLGFTKTTGSWFIDGSWHIGGRHHVYVDFVDTKRDATKAGISQPITIGDTTFQIGATVQAFVDNNYLTLDYGFGLTKNPKAEFVFTIGVSSVKVHTGFGLQAMATTGSSVSRSLEKDSQDRSIFPVPGLQFSSRVHPHVNLTGYVRFIQATLGGVKQGSADGRFGADFPLSHHIGFGATYYFNRVKQEGSRDTFTGKLRYRFSGPQLYGLVQF
jgi:hypothetical protein